MLEAVKEALNWRMNNVIFDVKPAWIVNVDVKPLTNRKALLNIDAREALALKTLIPLNQRLNPPCNVAATVKLRIGLNCRPKLLDKAAAAVMDRSINVVSVLLLKYRLLQ